MWVRDPDDLLEVRRDMSIDVMFLVETWHDTDSVAFQRLRADGFQVVDRPRPRSRADTLATNHGGLACRFTEYPSVIARFRY